MKQDKRDLLELHFAKVLSIIQVVKSDQGETEVKVATGN
jgi:hypothetical protein